MHKRSSSCSGSIELEDKLKHLVPFNQGFGGKERRDLAMALDFAFNNGQKFMMDSSMSRSMLAFLQQISHGSVIDFRNFERKGNLKGASSEFKISNYHINEVSKGAQKLNNILTACSEGIKPDMCSIEIGMELFKSAKNLEESLRMLIGLQEAAGNMTTPQRKSRIRLLEGNEDDVENPKLLENPKKIDRPRFSFDKQANLNNTWVNREGSNSFRQRSAPAVTAYLTNSEITDVDRSSSYMLSTVSHRRAFSDAGDSSSNTAASEERNDMTLNTLRPEKKCLPNIIAKLMGLEEGFQHINSNNEMHKESESKQKNVLHMKNKGVELSGHEMMKKRLLQAERIPIHDKTASLDRHEKKRESNGSFSSQNGIEGRKILQSDTENAKKKNIASTKRASKHIMSENNITQLIQPQIIRDKSLEKERNPVIANERKPKSSMKQVLSTNTLSQGKRSNQKGLHILPVKEILNKTINSSRKITQNQENLQKSFGSSKRILFGQHENIIERYKVDRKEQKLGIEKSHVKDQKDNETGMDQVARQYQTREKVFASSDVHSSTNRDTNIPDDIASCVFKNNTATDNNSDHSICSKEGVQTELRKTNGPLLKEDKYVKVTTSMDKVPKSRERKGNSLKVLDQVTSKNKDLLQDITTSQVQQIAISKDADSNSICYMDENSKIDTKPSPSTTTPPVNQEEKPSVLQIPNPADIPEAAASEASVCKHAPLCIVKDTVEARPYNVQPKEAYLSVAGIDKMSSDSSHVSVAIAHKTHKASKLDPLTEQESQLRDILVSNRRFQNTAVALFKLTIPVDDFQTGSQACEDQRKKFMLDAGYEIMKRKGKRQEFSIHPFSKLSISFPKVGSLEDLVKQLYKDFQMLLSYGGVFSNDAGTYLLNMVERDIYYSNPDINCMWDYGWDHSSFTLTEKDHTIQKLERFILDDLIDDILHDI